MLTVANAAAVTALFARCREHFLLQDGIEADLSDALALFRDVPTGKAESDQTIFGWCDDDGLCAVAAVLRDYPVERVWYLRLLLLAPCRRGQGLGRSLHGAIDEYVMREGGRELRLAVIEANVAAQRFWRSLGYREHRRVGSDAFKALHHRRIEMARDLGEPQKAA